MTEEKKNQTALIDVVIICPDSGEELGRIESANGKTEPGKIRCENCWSEHELDVPGFWIKPPNK